MATDLNDLVDALKRELATPGSDNFDAAFPNTSDDDLANTLADSFAEAQLDGYFPDNALDLDTLTVDPTLSPAGQMLVVIYAGMRVIRSQLRALNLAERYKAGPVEYEITRPASVLREELQYLVDRKNQLLNNSSKAYSTTSVMDAYYARQLADWSAFGGLYPAELPG